MASKQVGKAPASANDAVRLVDLKSSFRNRIRNGNFAINQRAVSGTVTLAAGAYGHDGVKGGGSGGTYTFTTSGLDTTLTITAGTLILPIHSSLIEGGAYAISWAGTAQGRAYVQGAGSAPSFAAMPTGGLLVTGVATGSNQLVEFQSGTLTRVQYEPGAAASPFERRDDEFDRCEKYYRRMRLTARSNATASGQNFATPINLHPPMMSTPTATGITGGTRGNIAAAIVSITDERGGRFEIQSSAVGDTYALSDLWALSAEI